MYSLLFLSLTAFTLSFLLTPLVRNLCLRLGCVDRPDQRRKLHACPIPRVGGLPVAFAYLAAFGLLMLSPLKGGDVIDQSLPLVWKLIPAAVVVFATGLLDDLLGLKPWQKLLGQLAASALAYWAGVQIHALGGFQFPHWWALPFTILWLLGCTNAFNLIDGLDGLAVGAGLFASLTILAAALLHGNMALALATAPLAASLLGFLRFNFNPASIFLGDCGSLWLGFVLGCYGILWSQKSATLLAMTAPLMALSIPLLDTAVAILRRFLRRQPIFGADHAHIHHRLLARGLTPRRAVLLLYGFCGLAAAFSLLQSTIYNQFRGLIIVLFCAVAWIGIQHLGYAEFTAARRLLFHGAFRRVLNAQLRLRSLEQDLAASSSLDQCWLALRDASRDFGFNQVALHFNHTLFEESLAPADPPNCWSLYVPLSASAYVSLAREFQRPVDPMVVGPFANTLRHSLQPALEKLSTPPCPLRPPRETLF